MHRIYFDSNEGPGSHPNDNRYGLWLNKSLEDLAKIPGGPQEGMTVTIYMTGEIEMEATLEWDAEWKVWNAQPILASVRDNHEAWD
jgi:hypothetical protein